MEIQNTNQLRNANNESRNITTQIGGIGGEYIEKIYRVIV